MRKKFSILMFGLILCTANMASATNTGLEDSNTDIIKPKITVKHGTVDFVSRTFDKDNHKSATYGDALEAFVDLEDLGLILKNNEKMHKVTLSFTPNDGKTKKFNYHYFAARDNKKVIPKFLERMFREFLSSINITPENEHFSS